MRKEISAHQTLCWVCQNQMFNIADYEYDDENDVKCMSLNWRCEDCDVEVSCHMPFQTWASWLDDDEE